VAKGGVEGTVVVPGRNPPQSRK